MEIVPVGADRRRARAWVDVQRRVHRGDPNWVPPLRADALRALDRTRSPLHRHADIEHFVLVEHGEPVGRIAATVMPEYVRRFGTKTGFFGFLSYVPGPGRGERLLRAAHDWLVTRGMDRVVGPYEYYSGQDTGLLLDGPDEPPAAFQTYNPPGHVELLHSVGYRTELTATTYRIDRSEAEQVLAGKRAEVDSVMTRHQITVRPLRRRRFAAEMELVRQLFNRSFADNDGVLPYQADVFAEMVRPLRRFATGNNVRFLERDGKPMGFLVVPPDINPLLLMFDGRVRLRHLPRLPRAIRELDGAVALIAGVLPGSPSGMSTVIVSQLFESFLGSPATRLRTSWVDDGNHGMRIPLIKWGMRPDRQYSVVGRALR